MADVVVLGSVNLDLVAEVVSLPRPGETVLAKHFREDLGGKGANQAVAAARMGANVAMVGATGADEAGRLLRQGLLTEGIEVSDLREVDEPSGRALILTDQRPENVIAVAAGANSSVGRHDADRAARLTRHGGVLLCQLEIPLGTVRLAAKAVRARGVTVVLNAAPATPLSNDLLASVDVLVVNEVEAATLTGTTPRPWPWAEETALSLSRAGPEAVLVTMSERGAVLARRSAATHVKAFPVEAVNSVGAGDAFAGALAVAISEGADLESATRTASAAAALTVRRAGAQSAMPHRDEVRRLEQATTSPGGSARRDATHPIRSAPTGPVKRVKRSSMGHDAFDLTDLVVNEIAQRRESGYEVDDIEARLGELGEGTEEGQLVDLLDQLGKATRRADWAYDEPTDLDDIRAHLAPSPAPRMRLAEDDLLRRLRGAWLGRCAGNNLGKPVENGDHWTPQHIRSYLELADAYPLLDYFPVLDPMPEGFTFRENWPYTTRGNLQECARDDDLDYTILGLHLLETYGLDYATEDVADAWLHMLPMLQTYTAERVAYRNLATGLRPPATASWRNPYREWIGAQIRADIFGYVCAGAPRQAALLAYRDAALSHTANGIYGEMWAAALVAAAFTAAGPREALQASLEHVPPRSRLAKAVAGVQELHRRGLSWENAREEIGHRLGHYGWVHTVNNAALVAAGLLWGEGDFSRTVGLTVQGGWDTDSNGATAGSVAGALVGVGGIPQHWTVPFQDHIRTAITGYDHSSISALARRTLRLALARRDADQPGMK